jgi:large exoprotein involved in heme utilization and adhesion
MVGGIVASTLAEGNAGDIDVQVGRLTLQNGGVISSGVGAALPDGAGGLIFIGVDNSGHGGNLTIHATESILISGQSSLGQRSGLFTSTVKGSGDGGQLFVFTPILDVRDGATISSATLAEGDGGSIDVQVGKLTVQNGGTIFSGVGVNLLDEKGGVIRIGVDNSGRGGNLTVKATESILISGRAGLFQPSGLFTNAFSGSGDGGQLFVSTPILDVRDGAFIAAGTQDKGKAGNIKLEVGRLTADSGFITSGTTGDNNAGDIEVQVGTLTLSNGGGILTSAEGIVPELATGGPGRAGNITVNATDSISIAGRDSDGFTSGLFTDAFKGSGDGGQIFVSAPVLDMRDGGEIFAGTSSESTGNAGDIRVEVSKLTMSGDADIATLTTGPGQGGDIHVQAQQIELNNNNKATLTASSFGSGDAGNIEIHADDTFRSRHSVVSTESTQSGGGKINLSAGQIVELVDSQITTTVQGGAGDAGNITIDPRYVILNDSQVIARAVAGNGGNINIGADVFIASPTSVVDASSQKGVSGTIDIRGVVNNLSGSLVPLPQGYLNITALSEDRCAGRLREGRVSSFVVAGREGMPLQPGGLLPSPLYETGQVSARSGPGSNEGHGASFDFAATQLRSGRTGLKGWQVPKITPISLDGGCGR